MKRRFWKYVGLAAAGGLLLQTGSCTAYLMETVVSYILPTLVSQILSGATTT